MAGHAQLKFVMTECAKTKIRSTGLNCWKYLVSCDCSIWNKINICGWLGQAMVLGSFHCRGFLLLWHMVGQVPAVLAAGAGRVDRFLVSFFFFFFLLLLVLFLFSSHLSYLPFLMPHLFGDGWTY